MSGLLLGVLAASLPSGGDFESIATVTVGAETPSSLSFSGVPTSFTHLQFRITTKYATASNPTALRFRFNSDATAANYWAHHQLFGNGTSASASTLNNVAYCYPAFHSDAASTPASWIVDIIDYASTSKYKVLRSFGGFDSNGTGTVALRSGLWLSTNAISAITIDLASGTFGQGSNIALYGLRAP